MVIKATSACIAARWPSATRLPRGDSPASVFWRVISADALAMIRPVSGLTASLASIRSVAALESGLVPGERFAYVGTILAVLWMISPVMGFYDDIDIGKTPCRNCTWVTSTGSPPAFSR